ncbi:MAG: protein kinase [Acidobacteriota bacterium]
MTPERWQRIDKLFDETLLVEPPQRAAFLDEACADDSDLRGEIESLLDASHQAGGFIESPLLSASENSGAYFASLAGQSLGPYRLLREIGRGGMGVVYLAARDDDQFQKQVAIKVVQAGPHSKDLLRRFRRERQILANLDHPNIARLLDGGTTEHGVAYLVMEYVAGTPITLYCDERKLSITDRLKLFRIVCAAVQCAHQSLVIHRDIKPGNILVSAEGEVKLLDFGIAKLLDAGSDRGDSKTTSGLHVMTPEYASPEQIQSETVTTASDVYSLGIVLYELLTGHYPYRFKDRSLPEILRVICEQEPEPPSRAISRVETRPGDGTTPVTISPETVSRTREGRPDKLRARLRGDLNDIALMALRKDPQQRYRTVEQLSEDIRRHLEGRPVLARKGTFVYRAGKLIRRYKTGAAVAVLILLTLLGGILATTRQANLARQLAVERRRLQYAGDMHMAAQAWEVNNVARVREFVERHVPREGEEDLRGFEWYYLWRLIHDTGELAAFQNDIQVWAVALSPDASVVATGDDHGFVTLWNADTNGKLAKLRASDEFIWDVEFSPDGSLLATAGDHGALRLWDAKTWRLITTLNGHADTVRHLSFSSDGKRLASGADDGTARVWEIATGLELTRVSVGSPGWSVRYLAFSPDGKMLACDAQQPRAVTMYDSTTGNKLREFAGRKGAGPIQFSPDGRSLFLIVGNTVVVVDARTGEETAVLQGHSGRIRSVAVSPDGETMATGSEDFTARVWDAATGAALRTFKGHEGTIFSVAFSRDCKTLATASSDLTARLWDIGSALEPAFLKTSDSQAVVFSPSRSRPAVAALGSRIVKLLDASNGKLIATFEGHSAGVWTAAFSPDGETLATGDTNGIVKLWNTASQRLLATFNAHSARVSSLMFSPDGRLLATGSYDATAKLWDAGTGELVLTLPTHRVRISAVAFAPDGLTVATGSLDGTATLTGRAPMAITGNVRGIASMAFSPNGLMLAIGAADGTVRLWDVKTGALIARLAGHAEHVNAVAFSPDSRRLAAGSNDGFVRLWDTSTHQEVIALQGHAGEISSVAFSPDGDTLVSGGYDTTIRFWRAAARVEASP